MEGCMATAGEGRLKVLGMVTIELGCDAIGVEGNVGLADAIELREDNISGVVRPNKSLRMAGEFEYMVLSDLSSPQSQKIASSEGFQTESTLCGVSDLTSEK